MAAIAAYADPTLEAVDIALEMVRNAEPPRPYLGMSGIAHPCQRKPWYDFRWITNSTFKAATLKKFDDGHRSEDVQAGMLRMVPGVELLTVDPETGKQFGFQDHNGHFRGHVDGYIFGILQAPKTPHIWEHKASEKQGDLAKLIAKHGEKDALEAWNPIYYGQGILYMHYGDVTRHYLTCSTPGARHTISVRTNANPEAALRLIARAQRTIERSDAPPRMSEDPAWFQCRWCEHAPTCHAGKLPERHCRSCICSTPVADGQWLCERFNKIVDYETQRKGCIEHLYLPSLVAGHQVDADANGNWVDYVLTATGERWRDMAVPF
jgi:predicted nucleic acid-binding Zn ribbon protein